MTFAVIKTGGKQYKVAQGDKILVEKLETPVGEQVTFDQVLMTDDQIGTPLVSGASVTGKVLDQGKAKKKIVFKYSSKTRYKKKKGHRQPFTKVEILSISGV
ncbi:MAG: 50S ribosomal protein L21 [Patescibacteria group bacterium]